VDLSPRQAEFADAALRLVARDGLSAVTFRSLATEAGMSLGAVQKAFPSKEQLLRAMFGRLRETASLPALGEPGRPTLRDWFVALMVTVLPLDAPRRAAELQGAAFVERAPFDAEIGMAVAASDQELRAAFASLVRRAQAEAEVPASIDPDATAWAVLAFMQGMASQLTYDPVAEEAVRDQCRLIVDALLHGSQAGEHDEPASP